MINKVPNPPIKSDDNNLRSNLCSNLCNNFYNNPNPQTASLISSNIYLFLCKHLISFRRFSVEDSETPAVPKVATKVATSVI